MWTLRARVTVITALGCIGSGIQAQEPKLAFPPPAADVVVDRDVRFGTSGTTALMMDVYHRPRSANDARPVLIFFNHATGADRSNRFYAAWARTAASRGLVAILPDLRGGSDPEDFQALLAHLSVHAAELGVDPDAVAVYAASGNVFTAFPLLEDPKQTAVKAAVIYYGTAPITQFRLDLPVLYVRAGLDRPSVNQGITTLAATAISQNAPVTLLNHPTGYHGFELFNDDDATRDVIEQTIEFVKRTTARSYRTALRGGLAEAEAAGRMLTGDFRQAASIYAELVRARPEDARLRLSYGEALLGDGHYDTACSEFESLKGKGLGYRDLGLPAARACMQKGDAEAAIAWLKSIPSRFLPPELEREATFASLQGRADFRALFRPQ